MSKINNPVETSIAQFIANEYNASAKNVIFWDTCTLLDVFRFPYRNGGTLNTFRLLNRINGLIQNDTVYSIASSLTIREYNDHEDEAKAFLSGSLAATDNYHTTCIGIANDIAGAAFVSESITNKNLLMNFEALVDNIISKTIFIRTDEIANIALERVRDKRPPSKKKPEFKDCAIWETALNLSMGIHAVDAATHQVFCSTNTEDYVDKSKVPPIFNGILTTEAAASNLRCCYTIDQVGPMI